MSYVYELVLFLCPALCSVWLQLCINVTLACLLAKHLTYVDQWTVMAAVIQACIFDRADTFCLQGEARRQGVLHALSEVRIISLSQT
jgi:hypothetical protein